MRSSPESPTRVAKKSGVGRNGLNPLQGIATNLSFRIGPPPFLSPVAMASIPFRGLQRDYCSLRTGASRTPWSQWPQSPSGDCNLGFDQTLNYCKRISVAMASIPFRGLQRESARPPRLPYRPALGRNGLNPLQGIATRQPRRVKRVECWSVAMASIPFRGLQRDQPPRSSRAVQKASSQWPQSPSGDCNLIASATATYATSS